MEDLNKEINQLKYIIENLENKIEDLECDKDGLVDDLRSSEDDNYYLQVELNQLENDLSKVRELIPNNLSEQFKIDFLIENLHKITLQQLESLIK